MFEFGALTRPHSLLFKRIHITCGTKTYGGNLRQYTSSITCRPRVLPQVCIDNKSGFPQILLIGWLHIFSSRNIFCVSHVHVCHIYIYLHIYTCGICICKDQHWFYVLTIFIYIELFHNSLTRDCFAF